MPAMGKYDDAPTPLPPSASGRPAFIRNLDEVPGEAYERKDVAGVAHDLGAAVGAQKLGLDVTVIPPGKNSSNLHKHSHKEEFFYVLSGRCKVRVGAAEHELRAGDAVSRPAGSAEHHQFFNPYDAPCSVMMIGVQTGRGLEDTVDWPEFKKKLIFDEQGARRLERA